MCLRYMEESYLDMFPSFMFAFSFLGGYWLDLVMVHFGLGVKETIMNAINTGGLSYS